MPVRRHFFVCITGRPPFARPSCGPRGSQELVQRLLEEIDTRGLAVEVAVNGSTCLGPCDSGPSVVVYPEGVWYQGVRPEDAAEIVSEHAVHGRPVERLRRRDVEGPA